ncbi:hypothetical protein H5410_060742 [Solanum commersonii]|uniref:Uncharacterized protein n=1 Tax=Solanum commersonii TaxID=4109 RepID=A0A9J5W708_SOLCO|nr:hypothetical protein H5410_060742 [Solanum commersonii]
MAKGRDYIFMQVVKKCSCHQYRADSPYKSMEVKVSHMNIHSKSPICRGWEVFIGWPEIDVVVGKFSYGWPEIEELQRLIFCNFKLIGDFVDVEECILSQGQRGAIIANPTIDM